MSPSWGRGWGGVEDSPLPRCAYSLSATVLQNRHCLLDIAPHAIERLHHMHIYPIVIFIRYKSAKHIKWVSGPAGSLLGVGPMLGR
jgi:hypothetical protein